MRRLVLALLVCSRLLGFAEQVRALGRDAEPTASLQNSPVERGIWVRSGSEARDALRPPDRGVATANLAGHRRLAPDLSLDAGEQRLASGRPAFPWRRLLRHRAGPPADAEPA